MAGHKQITMEERARLTLWLDRNREQLNGCKLEDACNGAYTALKLSHLPSKGYMSTMFKALGIHPSRQPGTGRLRDRVAKLEGEVAYLRKVLEGLHKGLDVPMPPRD